MGHFKENVLKGGTPLSKAWSMRNWRRRVRRVLVYWSSLVMSISGVVSTRTTWELTQCQLKCEQMATAKPFGARLGEWCNYIIYPRESNGFPHFFGVCPGRGSKAESQSCPGPCGPSGPCGPCGPCGRQSRRRGAKMVGTNGRTREFWKILVDFEPWKCGFGYDLGAKKHDFMGI